MSLGKKTPTAEEPNLYEMRDSLNFRRDNFHRCLLYIIGITTVFTVYEILKESIFPFLSKWESHVISIFVVTIISTFIILRFFRLFRRQLLVSSKLANEITNRRQVGEALRESERRLKEAEQIALLGHWELDLVSNTLYWSDEIYRIFDLEPQEFGASYEAFLDTVHPQDREFVNKTYTESLKNKTTYDIVHRLQMKDGTVKYVHEKCKTEYDEDGNPLRSLGTVQDITERKETEKKLRDTQKELLSKKKLAAVGQVAGSISHDLRNPLGIIGNSVYYLNMKLKDVSDEKVRKHLGIIHREVKRSNRIINDLLDIARIKPLSLVETDVNLIIRELLSAIKIPENVVLYTRLDVNVPGTRLDPEQIRRVFHNILSNAFHAMPKGGKLDIETRVKENFIDIIFKDSGEGVTEENLEKIFEPLFTTKANGIGLGLTIVKDIVERHTGNMEVESKVGEGTTFTVRLPLRMESEG